MGVYNIDSMLWTFLYKSVLQNLNMLICLPVSFNPLVYRIINKLCIKLFCTYVPLESATCCSFPFDSSFPRLETLKQLISVCNSLMCRTESTGSHSKYKVCFEGSGLSRLINDTYIYLWIYITIYVHLLFTRGWDICVVWSSSGAIDLRVMNHPYLDFTDINCILYTRKC